ncbi:hypothetical protein [Rhodococcus sp. NPDC047139]
MPALEFLVDFFGNVTDLFSVLNFFTGSADAAGEAFGSSQV